jgi:CRP/FNR family cyclic AMP-dependent transcriptional regulator
MADLSAVKLFAGLPDKELRAIQRDLREVRHPAGREIVVRGDNGIGFMIIESGRVKVKLANGVERSLGSGDSFGEMALLDQEGRSATIVTEDDVNLLTIPEWAFKSFLTEHPEIAYRLLQQLSHRVRLAEEGR